jgi:hypothetical protein
LNRIPLLRIQGATLRLNTDVIRLVRIRSSFSPK